MPESVIDDKVRRILRLQLSIGMMDRYRLSGQRNTPEHRAAALDIAREGVTLLKNDNGVLPLDASQVKKVLMIGPNVHRESAWATGSKSPPCGRAAAPCRRSPASTSLRGTGPAPRPGRSITTPTPHARNRCRTP
ncbi:MAG: hypothetical protein P8Y52_14195 [Xanthomonadales bacterium]